MVITPPIQLGTIGMDDTLILMVLALVLLGPRRLPQVGRQIGKLMYEFRKASNDFKYQLEEELRNAEEADKRKREEAERQRALTDAQHAVAQAQSAAETALQAAAQAQNAAQAALTAAAESTTAAEIAVAEIADPSAPDMIYTFGSSEVETVTTKTLPAAEPVETGQRIQPPTTGEPVPAERPGRVTTEPSAGPGDPGADSSTVSDQETLQKKEVAAPQHPAATEPSIHHG